MDFKGPRDFESRASTNFATPAAQCYDIMSRRGSQDKVEGVSGVCPLSQKMLMKISKIFPSTRFRD